VTRITKKHKNVFTVRLWRKRLQLSLCNRRTILVMILGSYAIKLARWQHPVMRRETTFAAPGITFS